MGGGGRTLGPVAPLERHVPPDWWRTLFNANYLKTDGDVVDDALLTRHEVDRLLSVMQQPRDARLLDLCCGQGRHSLELAQRGFTRVEGLDRSRYLVRRARGAAKDAGLAIRFREGDARRLPYRDGSFDVVLSLGNSFGYFAAETDDRVLLSEAKRALTPGGSLVMDIADGDAVRESFERRSWEWIDGSLLVCRERELSLDGRRLISREVIVHARRGVIADQFYAERLYGAGEIRRLLRDEGFLNVQLHGTHVTESQRNQDLGMMARRLLVSATRAGGEAPDEALPFAAVAGG